MNVDDLPVPNLAAAEPERESAIEAILSDNKTAKAPCLPRVPCLPLRTTRTHTDPRAASAQSV